MAWKVGCGDIINFWTDRWVREECTLEHKYNQLFMISRQQHSLISMMGTFSQDNWRWDLKWRRNLFDHENDLAVNFMEDITSISIQKYVKDTMMWKAESSGVYSTKSAYRLMLNTNAPGLDVRNFKLIWKMEIPPWAAETNAEHQCPRFRCQEFQINMEDGNPPMGSSLHLEAPQGQVTH